jgi:hypothetical protein
VGAEPPRLLPNEFSELELHSAAPIIRTTF